MLKSLLNSAQKSISIILIMLMIPFNLMNLDSTHEAKNPDEVKTRFTVLSDCHIEGNNLKTYEVFADILSDVKSTDKNDAVVFLGDNTMNGQIIESEFFYGALRGANLADEVLVVAGNHDYSNGEGLYPVYLKRFLDYNNKFLGAGLAAPYYFRVINGCFFIVLSTEAATVNFMEISDLQLKWLEAVLKLAEKSGNPIFVFNHYPVDYIEDDDTERLSSVLDDYDNLIYFCGHTHDALWEGSIYECNGVKSINIPKTTEHAIDDYDCGVGAVVEVYDDEVLVRIRDFYDSCWVEGYEVSYPIVK